MEINKQQLDKKYFSTIEIILDNDIPRLVQDITLLRDKLSTLNVNSFRTEMNEYLRKTYAISPHTLRAIYARYIFQFRNPEKIAFGFLINKYLNHKTGSGSATSYDQINLLMSKDVFKRDFSKLKMPELKKEAQGRGITIKNKNKSQLILELNNYLI